MKLRYQLLLVLTIFSFTANAVLVSGTVTDSKHQPVPFCSVYLKGTTVGTTANIDGKYSLEVKAGTYQIVFRSIGYKLIEQQIKVENAPLTVNISIDQESYQLKEAVVNASAEDPAYAIIRHAIKMRKKYLDEAQNYQCEAYEKQTWKLPEAPKKLLGQKIDFGDDLDSTSKIVYLSETVSKLSFQNPDHKEEMISSRVRGNPNQYSFNQASYLRLNFYESLTPIGQRGIVSPISATAMVYYDYKLEGTFIQNGETVNKIKVIPKRIHDPVYTGDIYILDDSWRIHSLDLFITGNQQMQFFDTIRVTQTYVPVEKSTWMLLNSEVNATAGLFGFRISGTALGIFSNYNLHPDFPPHFFNSEVMKINKDANKKDTSYWDTIRPVPVTLEEHREYVKHDSLYSAHNTKAYNDSMDRKNNKFSPVGFLLGGYSHQNTWHHSSTSVSGLINNLEFNTVEGWAAGVVTRYDKQKDEEDRRRISVIADTRYGFSNQHFNGNLTFQHRYNPNHFSTYSVSGGTQVNDFNGNTHFSPLVNTGYSLLARKNWLKLYEKYYGSVMHRMELFNGVSLRVASEYADRIPLINTTDFAWIPNAERPYLSNDPLHVASDSMHFDRSQSFTIEARLRIRFKQKYMMRPEGKTIMGSKYPQLTFSYLKAIPAVADADVDYDFASAAISDEVRLGLLGAIRYSVSAGKFFSSKKMELMDYHHFNGNKTIFADFSLNDFELLDYYKFATNREYIEAHAEYNLGGLVLNKIPLIRKLKLNEIVGAHYFTARYFTAPFKNYFETSFGIEKFGLLRADFVLGFDDRKKALTGFVLGLKVNISNGSINLSD